LPNFTINSQYNIGFNNPRPVPALRVDTHTPWLRSHADVVADKAHNVGVVYFSHKAGNDWEGVSAATFFVLSHNGKRVGVTALHAVQGSSSMLLLPLHLYQTAVFSILYFFIWFFTSHHDSALIICIMYHYLEFNCYSIIM
jgi:hypothetical protein